MPRKKTIDTDVIKFKNIDQSIIERKDCLRVKLCFKNIREFTPDQRTTMGSYFGCRFVNDNMITLVTRNSWKGLIMFFLSLAYMKFDKKLEQVLWLMARPNMPRQITITNVSWDYWFLVKDNIGKWETRSDPRIERIPASPGTSPCYVVGEYDPKSIKQSLDNFCILYGIDIAQSTVETACSKQVPHQYKQYPVENPYKGPEIFRPSTFEELWNHPKEKGLNSLEKIDLAAINPGLSESSVENPCERPEPFYPSTFDEFLKYAMEGRNNPLSETNLTGTGSDQSENSEENF